MRILLLLFGFISISLGIIGIVLPVLPTTPFFLLALYLFTKSSKRVETWFLSTKLYHKYLKSFHKTKTMSLKQKTFILLFSDTMIITSFIIVDSWILRIVLIVLNIIKYWYFITQIKTWKGAKEYVL